LSYGRTRYAFLSSPVAEPALGMCLKRSSLWSTSPR